MSENMRKAVRDAYNECTSLDPWIIKRYLDNIDKVLSGEFYDKCICHCCYINKYTTKEAFLHRIATILNSGRPVNGWSKFMRYLKPGARDPRHYNEKGNPLISYWWYSDGSQHAFKTKIGGVTSYPKTQLLVPDNNSEFIYFCKYEKPSDDVIDSGEDTEPEINANFHHEYKSRPTLSITNSNRSSNIMSENLLSIIGLMEQRLEKLELQNKNHSQNTRPNLLSITY